MPSVCLKSIYAPVFCKNKWPLNVVIPVAFIFPTEDIVTADTTTTSSEKVVTPAMFRWLWKWRLPALSILNRSVVSFVCKVNWLSTPAGVVILVIPYILFKLICDIILFIIQLHNYHQ